MEIEIIKRAIIKKLWLVILITMVCTGITYYISVYKIKPIYRADITVYVVSKNSSSTSDNSLNYNDIMVNREMIKDYPNLLVSKKVTSGAIDKLGIENLTAEELAKNLSIKTSNDTNVFVITVRDNSAERAKKIANTVGEVFITTVRNLTNQNNLNIVDSADLPAYPENVSRYNNIFLSFIVSLLGSMGIIALAEYKDTTIKTVEQVEGKIGYRVIGIIPEMNIK